MDICYVRILPTAAHVKLDPSNHMPWEMTRDLFLQLEKTTGCRPFWLLDSGLSSTGHTCRNVTLDPTSGVAQIYNTQSKRMLILTIQKSKELTRWLTKKSAPVKVYLTPYVAGKRTKHWYLVIVFRRHFSKSQLSEQAPVLSWDKSQSEAEGHR